jgi:hypothetical protein
MKRILNFVLLDETRNYLPWKQRKIIDNKNHQKKKKKPKILNVLSMVLFLALSLTFIGCNTPAGTEINPPNITENTIIGEAEGVAKVVDNEKVYFKIQLPKSKNEKRNLIDLQNNTTDYELLFIDTTTENRKSFIAVEGYIEGFISVGTYDILLLAGEDINENEIKLLGSGFLEEQELITGDNYLHFILYSVDYSDVELQDFSFLTPDTPISFGYQKNTRNTLLEKYYPLQFYYDDTENFEKDSNDAVFPEFTETMENFTLQPLNDGTFNINIQIFLKPFIDDKKWVFIPLAEYATEITDKARITIGTEYGDA